MKKYKNLIPQSIKNLFHLISAVIANVVYAHPAKDLTVIGVTGTDGKTTTSSILYHILKENDKKVALISTVAAYIGKNEIDTGFHVTSPNAWQLQKLLRRIVDEGFTYVVIEATSHGLDQHRLHGIHPTISIITNVTSEHLDYHRTYDNYLKAKAKLFENTNIAILNQEDRSFEKLAALIKDDVFVYTYDQKEANSTRSIKERFSEDYNRLNALAALKAAILLGIEDHDAARALETFKGVRGRMEEIKNDRDIKLIIDFAHTPNALENALLALKKDTKNKVIAVYGAAGERDHYKRPHMGKIGASLADEVVLTAEDPRTEDVRTIIRQMKEGVEENHGHIHAIVDRQEAISFAINTLAKPGDAVGIFGKGHERSMNLDGKTESPWSDHQAVKKALSMIG